MKVRFRKMHGAGNDFVVIDDRSLTFPTGNTEFLRHLGARQTGVGCDGILLVQPSDESDFRMRFFNPDGSEVDMCGNGARCIAKFAHDSGVAGPEMKFMTGAGIIGGRICRDGVEVGLTNPHGWEMNASIDIDGNPVEFSYVNTGVPHAVIFIEDPDTCDVTGLGREIRYHEHFSPNGTNADFVKVTGRSSLDVRTYERGVEDETFACGTGITASALIAARLGLAKAPVSVTARSGDILVINFDVTDDGAENVTLFGPAIDVYDAVIEI